MPSIAESRAAGQAKLESGQWKYVTEPTAPPAIPAPTNAYPAAPNQYLRAPLPADQWQDPDAQRQFHAPAIPQTRISPLPANTSPVAGAQAASQAIQLIQSTPAAASGVTSVGLTMPTPVFVTPVSGSPITSSGTLAPQFAPENFNYVFAGPGGPSGNISLDGTTSVASSTATNTSPYTASVTVSQANDFVLCVLGALGSSPTLPAGFTTISLAGSPQLYIGSTISTGAGTITASGVAGAIEPIVEILAAFKSGGVTPTVRQTGSSSVGVGTHSVSPFGLSVLANSTIIVIPVGTVVGAGTAAPSTWTIADSQSNFYTQIQNGYSSYAPASRAAFAQVFAMPATTAGSLSFTVTNPSNLWGTPTVTFLEVTGLAAPSFIPTFRPLVSADIPNLDASKITTGKLALAQGGTNADLSATGGTSQVLKQTSAGAAVTVAQLAASDLSNGTTGSGAVVLAASPTITGTAALASETLSGKITNYNGIATVSNGIPAEYATVDLTAQAAAIGATTLYTPTATGMFRISAYLKVTTVDATSSTLGAVTITYTDGTDSVAQSAVMQMANESGASVTSNSGNTTAAKLIGSTEIWALTGVAIQYAVAYASNIAGTMKYEVHLKLEAL